MLIIAILTPIYLGLAFYIGYMLGRTATKETKEPVKITNPVSAFVPRANVPIKPVPETPEDKQARIVYENIDNYGTRIPQKEVE